MEIRSSTSFTTPSTDIDASHLRELLQKAERQSVALEEENQLLKKKMNECIGYLFLMKDDRTLSSAERALIEMCLTYLRG